MDTVDDPGNDNDFTPTGAMQWNTHKLDNKIANLQKVIGQIKPDIMGIGEVEHKALLLRLLKTPGLRNISYGIAHFESPDERGIDVALIYNQDKLHLLAAKPLKLQLPDSDATRDILYVSLITKFGKDTLHVFVNHWPSRRGGNEKSEVKRIAAAGFLYDFIIKNELNSKKTIIVGDFNDDPGDASIDKYLHAVPATEMVNLNDSAFINLNALINTDTLGTLSYANHWNMFDQMMLSNALWHSASKGQLSYRTGSFGIFAPYWIRQHESKYEGQPLRTFGGKKWLRGYSDHFPVYAELIYE